MTESIVPMLSLLLFTPGACPAFRSGRCQGIGHTGKNMPSPSVQMSSGRLFLTGWSPPEPAALRRHAQNNLLAFSIASVYHRMVPSVLTGCLTPGGHPMAQHYWRRNRLAQLLAHKA